MWFKCGMKKPIAGDSFLFLLAPVYSSSETLKDKLRLANPNRITPKLSEYSEFKEHVSLKNAYNVTKTFRNYFFDVFRFDLKWIIGFAGMEK